MTRCKKCNSVALKTTYEDGGTPLCRRCLGAEPKKVPDGTRSSVMPKSLAVAYEKARVDNNLISLREDIATYEARAQQLLAQISIDERNSPNWAQVLTKLIARMEEEINKGSITYRIAFYDIKEFMESAVKENMIWAEVHVVTDLRRKMIAAESKRLKDLGWSPEAVMAGFTEIAEIIKPMLTDDQMKEFLASMARSKLFNGQQFSIIDQIDLTQRTLEEQLFAHEHHKVITTNLNEGVYEPDDSSRNRGDLHVPLTEGRPTGEVPEDQGQGEGVGLDDQGMHTTFSGSDGSDQEAEGVCDDSER